MLDWLYEIVTQLIVWIHTGLSTVVPKDSGWAWGGSIILLTVLLRLVMVPLFVKQIHASRKMQELNPKVQALRKKYKNDKQRLNQEVMKLYQENGANPLSGCLPLLVQMPVFIGLFQALKNISDAKPGESVFGMSADLVASAQHASIFGAHIPDTFLNAWGSDPKSWTAIAITGIAVVISSCTTFFTVRASMKRQPVTDDANPMMQAQKMMVFMAPLFGLFGLGFPLGVLMYWVTSNSWTLAQQHYIYKKYPPLSTDDSAATAKAGGTKTGGSKTGSAKTGGAKAGGTKTGGTKTGGGAKASAAKNGQASSGIKARLKKEPEPEPEPETKPKVVRNQPTRKSRSKRSGTQKR
ncbi:membrane protein insertase YidC [Actinomadura madurae]|uniref:membrane protein insertase YidC n=1 Tax=Actinomadura madurae TaxID=1993 RepID=UPI0020D22B39|nr:membrane protein insertase YidC [Actinomadura madurae]MCP9952200.1 membrane protein insertase YidC [Actinomadura madurae]MCP9968957.1 membrane protein insertase YidC [Actinomadura madurae]MCP9981430.1 membrane protein insertase YidC [Actinomadura madurae]MCQ0007058.1 membrane protein insertase YidC [Actinomadura madurae]